MTTLILNQSKNRVPKTFLENFVKKAARQLQRKNIGGKFHQRELVLVFLPKAKAKSLNYQFRRKNYATDVLSFGSSDPEVLGELVICPEVIIKQAKQNKWPQRNEYAYMVLHGLLHLLGYDHETSEKEKEAEKMFSLQDEVFEKII